MWLVLFVFPSQGCALGLYSQELSYTVHVAVLRPNCEFCFKSASRKKGTLIEHQACFIILFDIK